MKRKINDHTPVEVAQRSVKVRTRRAIIDFLVNPREIVIECVRTVINFDVKKFLADYLIPRERNEMSI